MIWLAAARSRRGFWPIADGVICWCVFSSCFNMTDRSVIVNIDWSGLKLTSALPEIIPLFAMGCSSLRAKRSNHHARGVSCTRGLSIQSLLPLAVLVHPRSRVMTTEHVSAISRHNAPEFCNSFALKRGRREDRVRAAPAVSCAMCTRKTHTSIQVQRKHSGLPCAMVLRLISCSCVSKICQNVRTGGSEQPPVAGSEPVRARRP